MRRWLSYAETMIGARIEWIGGATYEDYEAECPPPYTPPPRPKPVDPYKTLHLLPSAPPELVRAAFKCLAAIFHPDKPGGDEERMKAINRAYEKLAA
jgi:DnaJ-class molecular chaperone